ncbi:unnamed protein product, partial [Vitis vinifera]
MLYLKHIIVFQNHLILWEKHQVYNLRLEPPLLLRELLKKPKVKMITGRRLRAAAMMIGSSIQLIAEYGGGTGANGCLKFVNPGRNQGYGSEVLPLLKWQQEPMIHRKTSALLLPKRPCLLIQEDVKKLIKPRCKAFGRTVIQGIDIISGQRETERTM